MIVFRSSAGGSRFRGVVPQEVYDQTPVEARDPEGTRLVHWSAPPGGSDPFLDGAYWALSWSLDLVFGDLLGSLLNEATVTNVERWNGSDWVPLA